jgi:hypothetical protein
VSVCIHPAVACDGKNCGDAFAANFAQWPNKHGRFGDTWRRDARKEAHAEGWKTVGTEDYCPRCAKTLPGKGAA